MGCQDIKLIWNTTQKKQMLKTVNDLFDFLKTKETDKVDLVHLKAYFSNQNVHNLNPTLFKRVNNFAL